MPEPIGRRAHSIAGDADSAPTHATYRASVPIAAQRS